MAATRSPSASPKAPSGSLQVGLGRLARRGRRRRTAVAPPIMCSSTPRTVKSSQGVGASSWSGRDAGDDAAEVRAELLELGERIHGSSSRGSSVVGAPLGRLPIAAGVDELRSRRRGGRRAATGSIMPDRRRAVVGHAPHSPARRRPGPRGANAPSPAARAARRLVRPADAAPAGRSRTIDRRLRDRLGARDEESAMRKAANEMATELEVGDIHTKGEDWGGQSSATSTSRPAPTSRPLLRGPARRPVPVPALGLHRRGLDPRPLRRRHRGGEPGRRPLLLARRPHRLDRRGRRLHRVQPGRRDPAGARAPRRPARPRRAEPALSLALRAMAHGGRRRR